MSATLHDSKYSILHFNMDSTNSTDSSRSTDSTETRIQLALDAYRSQKVPSLNQAAKLFNVPPSTLKHRNHGRRSAKESQQAQQRLSVAEEQSIKLCILQMAAWGWPISIPYLEGLVLDLLKKRGDTEPLGNNWYKSFLARHPDIKLKLARTHDQSRKDAGNYKILEH